MEKTCGVYIINPVGDMLVCHPSECPDRWGIPKGRPNKNEDYLDAAIREVYEETNIDLKGKKITLVGEELYSRKPKILIAYTVILLNSILISDMKCKSLFKSRYSGDMIPEIDRYQWVEFDKFKHKIQDEQVRLWERSQLA